MCRFIGGHGNLDHQGFTTQTIDQFFPYKNGISTTRNDAKPEPYTLNLKPSRRFGGFGGFGGSLANDLDVGL